MESDRYSACLAAFASHPAESRGRLYGEPESPSRSAFQRDRDRIIHCGAFRRLKYKTQVFVYHEGDYYRTRLTHSLEVAQIARSICRALGLNEDLAEALALAHDFGHPPFAHAGEQALNEALTDFGGFDHNAQSLRILTSLEHRYARFDGLNLTWESLEGILKHNGPLQGAGKDLPFGIADYLARHDLEITTYAGPEAQVAAIADDIAYNNHDLDDGLRAGLFGIDRLADVPLVGAVFAEVRDLYPGLERGRLTHESIRRLIDRMVSDILRESRREIEDSGVANATEVRHLGRPLIAFSSEMAGHERAIKAFLKKNMYEHEKVRRMTEQARRVVGALLALYIDRPQSLPAEWRAGVDHADDTLARVRLVADFVAGMTDRFALREHARLVGGGNQTGESFVDSRESL